MSGGDVEALAAASGIEAFGGDGFNGAATIVAVMGGQLAPRPNRTILYPKRTLLSPLVGASVCRSSFLVKNAYERLTHPAEE